MRIWVASSNYAEDLRIDHSILDQHADSYRKIRNTFRYLLGNLNDNFEEIELEKININLSRIEKIKKFLIIKKQFTIENNMMTPTLKLKRYKIIETYKNEIEKLF